MSPNAQLAVVPQRDEEADFSGIADYLGSDLDAKPIAVENAAPPIGEEDGAAELARRSDALCSAGEHENTSCPAEAVVPPTEADGRAATKPPMDTPELAATTAPSVGQNVTSAKPLLDEIWPAQPPQRKREIPRRAIAVVGGVVLLIVLTLLCANAAHQPVVAIEAQGTDGVPEELVVSERDLKHRVQITSDYFRPRRVIQPNTTSAPEFRAPPLGSSDSPDEARRRRGNDPEDLISHRRAADSESHPQPASASGYRRPYLYYPSVPTPTGTGAAAQDGIVAPAGTVVAAVLATPVSLPGNGGSALIVAQAEGEAPLPKGSQLLGNASADEGGRLTIRFNRLILPDKREAKLEGEAQDESGSFGLAGVVNTHTADRAREVATGIATSTAADSADSVLSSLTGGYVNGIVSGAVDHMSTHEADRNSTRITLAKGTRFKIFMTEAAVVRR